MTTKKLIKLLALYLPYILLGLVATNFGEAWRLAEGKELGDKIMSMMGTIPVATVALNGAKNAAWLAAEILALSDDALAEKLEAERVSMAQQIAAKEEKLQNELNEL